MFCKNCSNDKFVTIKVFRNKDVKEDGKWCYSDNIDIRRVICDKCGFQFFTRTVQVLSIGYDRRSNEQFTLPLE